MPGGVLCVLPTMDAMRTACCFCLQVSQQTMWDLWMPFAAHAGCSEEQANEMCRQLQEARNAGQALSAKTVVAPYLRAQSTLSTAMQQVEQAVSTVQVRHALLPWPVLPAACFACHCRFAEIMPALCSARCLQDAKNDIVYNDFPKDADACARLEETHQEAWAALKMRIAELSASIGSHGEGALMPGAKAALPHASSGGDAIMSEPLADPAAREAARAGIGKPPSGLRSVSKGVPQEEHVGKALAPVPARLALASLPPHDPVPARAPAQPGDLLDARLQAIRRANQEADDSNTSHRI